MKRRNDGLYKRCGCAPRQWTKCTHPWHFAFCHGRTSKGKARYRFSLHRFGKRPASYVMSRSEAEALADRIRTDVRNGVLTSSRVINAERAATPELTLIDVANRYLTNYARNGLRRPHAVRQFEIYIGLLVNASVPAAGDSFVSLGAKAFKNVSRADLDAVFTARVAALKDAREAVLQIEALRISGELVPPEMRQRAALAGRSSKGGQVGLNRFKSRVRHFFNWAVAEGYRDDTPVKRHGVNVVRLNGSVESARTRRLQPGEEEKLVAAAPPHLRALIIATLSTGCRIGELLKLQWHDVEADATGRYRRMILRAHKTKTSSTRVIPIGQRLAAVLEMLSTDPAGEPLGPDAFVFGDEVGGGINSVKTAWRTACAKAEIADLHFHDLRREFACRLLESRAELHDVRDFLGHANITTTSRYLRSSTLRLERALSLLEGRRHLDEAGQTKSDDSRTGATRVPHEVSGARDDEPSDSREDVDAIEDVLVSPEGIEPSTNRLRVCCSAS